MNVLRRLKSIVALATFAALPVVGFSQSALAPNDLVVHEWGTFLAMQGSDGVTLDGMYHEEHALPTFVHSRGRDQLRLPRVQLKGETPVIYFYTKQPQKVRVTVDFPQGIWTQWFPQAQLVSPTLASPDATKLKNGRIAWSAELIPQGTRSSMSEPPATSPESLWNFARDVDAAYVKTSNRTTKPPQSELDRFIFYRGLGRATLPLELNTADGDRLSVRTEGPSGVKHLFILRVEQGKGAYRYLPGLAPGESVTNVVPALDEALPLDQFTGRVADDLAARLVECGLYAKEARAMVNTWSASYFQADGIRVLFVLPQAWTDAFIPLTISPKPREVVRVMVGRLDVLTPERERLAESAVRNLSSTEAETREAAFNTLSDQRRYVEPILRRLLERSDDPGVRTLCRRLLTTDFVTDLRAAVNSPTNGARIYEDSLYVRARLASLLREAGLDAQAEAEVKRAAADLAKMEVPPMTEEKARGYLRALAHAREGAGDAPGATEACAKFIRFGSQVSRRKQCVGCHQGSEAPRDMAWYRDWWVGERFARCAQQTGQTDTLLAEQETALKSDPHDSAALLMQAYLYRAKGDALRAENAWSKLGAPAPHLGPVTANAGGIR